MTFKITNWPYLGVRKRHFGGATLADGSYAQRGQLSKTVVTLGEFALGRGSPLSG